MLILERLGLLIVNLIEKFEFKDVFEFWEKVKRETTLKSTFTWLV